MRGHDQRKLVTPPEYDGDLRDKPTCPHGEDALCDDCVDDEYHRTSTGQLWFRLSCLARNLAIGGALCRAWDQGYWTCFDGMHDVPVELIEPRWEPGCNIDPTCARPAGNGER